MKTAEQIAERLWKKHHLKVGPDSWEVIDKEVLLLILHEYGAAVRQRAVAASLEQWKALPSYLTTTEAISAVATAIERMELP